MYSFFYWPVNTFMSPLGLLYISICFLVESDPCTINNPCVNGGVCISNGDSYRCSCPLYYTGYNCEGTHANT